MTEAAPAGPVGEGAGREAGGTTELGIDIIRVGRIADTLARFGSRFSERVLTPAERRYVRDRPETFAGRWAAKEAVSKVLGLGVRGIGWRDIEIERLPTGQPAVRLHGRAAGRAEQLGMGRVAVSISHEADFAVAIAQGVRSVGGRYVFPLDIEERLDDRERRILARMERLRRLSVSEAAGREATGREAAGREATGREATGREAERSDVGEDRDRAPDAGARADGGVDEPPGTDDA
jgi:holo-[acyl-carrier protein] synthase